MPLSPDLEAKLILAAEEGVKNAYTSRNKSDDFRIGAAVLTEQGNIYSSGQYVSGTLSLTLHAEQAVLAHAAAHWEHGVVAIAVTGNEIANTFSNNEPIYPCHMCKQILWESSRRSGLDMEIIIVQRGKILERLTLSKIMSYTWPK